MQNLFDPINSEATSESAFMPMVDALMVILSIFFIAFIVLNASPPPPPGAYPPFSLASDRYFASASFSLSDEARSELRAVLADSFQIRYDSLKKENKLDDLKFIIIEGHADRVPYPSPFYESRIFRDDFLVDGNEELSYFRAFTVFHELINVIDSTRSFADHKERIIVAGTGSRNPYRDKPGDIEENRRIMIHFVFDESER